MTVVRWVAAVALVLAWGLAGLERVHPRTRGDGTRQLRRMYERAIEDAKSASPGEISRNLIAITEHNRALLWKGEAGHRRVLVVTWTGSQAFDGLAGRETTTTDDVWVTAVPEMREFLRRTRPRNIRLRCAQVLGLPPEVSYDRFVELWVDPRDLFRPSPDPEITDHEAELDFPRSSRYITVSPLHVAWFENLRNTTYGTNGYPWTRLGYTYDWGNPRREIGLSEFVIREGATVEVRSVTGTREYGKRGP